jgi:hypothetical protein
MASNLAEVTVYIDSNDPAVVARMQELIAENERLGKERDAAVRVLIRYISPFELRKVLSRYKGCGDDFMIARDSWGHVTVGDINTVLSVYDGLKAQK